MAEQIPTPIPEDVKARFWSKADKRAPDECWPWLGAHDGRYGQFWWRGKRHKANRLALALATDTPISTERLACHKCDNPICVNPNHLFWGTHSDNTKDGFRKGRIRLEPMIAANHNKAKTHCQNGHPLSGDNLCVRANGTRRCKACQKQFQRRYLAKVHPNGTALTRKDTPDE